jgi:hypothetical protein
MCFAPGCIPLCVKAAGETSKHVQLKYDYGSRSLVGDLSFGADGTGILNASVSTIGGFLNSSWWVITFDQWHAAFDVQGSDGQFLFSVGEFTGPNMVEGRHYSWIEHFHFDQNAFTSITLAQPHFIC